MFLVMDYFQTIAFSEEHHPNRDLTLRERMLKVEMVARLCHLFAFGLVVTSKFRFCSESLVGRAPVFDRPEEPNLAELDAEFQHLLGMVHSSSRGMGPQACPADVVPKAHDIFKRTNHFLRTEMAKNAKVYGIVGARVRALDEPECGQHPSSQAEVREDGKGNWPNKRMGRCAGECGSSRRHSPRVRATIVAHGSTQLGGPRSFRPLPYHTRTARRQGCASGAGTQETKDNMSTIGRCSLCVRSDHDKVQFGRL